MKVLYIANFDAGQADDEGAVIHALRELGHEASPVREQKGFAAYGLDADFLLFHKWSDTKSLEWFRGKMPRVFWYWDLVNWPSDPTLANRCQARKDWMAAIMPHVELGFCSDGDWVAQDRTGKLVWLLQGADGRIAGTGSGASRCDACDSPLAQGPAILFAGISRGGGEARIRFVEEMRQRWGSKFRHVPKGVYREALADLISGSQIVVAPDSPVTDRYYSVRLYTMLGFGAFLLHPYSARAAEHYEDGKEIVFYHNRLELHEQIRYYLNRPEERQRIAMAGLARTRSHHLYRHRCEELVRVVQERFR